MEWDIKKIRLDLKYTWKISRNASDYKENFIISCKQNGEVGLGEVAPNIRYHETPESIETSFLEILPDLEKAHSNPHDFSHWLNETSIPNALKFGLESAFMHAFCKQNQISLSQFLGIPKPQSVETCYTLPIMETEKLSDFYNEYNLSRFKNLKVKVTQEESIDTLSILQSLGNHTFWIDANEAWKDVDALIAFLPKLKEFTIAFVEQPMPAAMEEEYVKLKVHTPFPIMADESVLNQPNFEQIKKQFHGVNMKLMKAGGYLNGLRILHETKKHLLIPMVGCMVETTLGIKSAWHLSGLATFSDLDGCLLLANEPFHLLTELDGHFYENKA